MSPSEDDSSFDRHYNAMNKNRWAEPHGPAEMPGAANGYAAHIAR